MNFEVRRDDLRTSRVVDTRTSAGDGEVLLAVDLFALTSNNVTYAVFGDAMRYWAFFPADGEGWGRVPVWGFADVEQSNVEGISDGERVYGYLPMASHLVVSPDRVTDVGFVDTAAHRAALPPVYNHYQRVERGGERERETAVLRPLFTTSFLIDDWLADDDMFGATSVVLASASSKTALGLAFLLSKRADVEVVGLTSPGNAKFVDGVGYYDRTVTYDDIASLPADVPTAFVDMAGGGVILSKVHNHFAYSLKTSCLVGATHASPGFKGARGEESAPLAELPGPQPTFFFAPDRIVKRRADWGPGGMDQRVDAAWTSFLGSVDGWLDIVERTGPDELADTWLDVLDGRTPANVGYVVSPTF